MNASVFITTNIGQKITNNAVTFPYSFPQNQGARFEGAPAKPKAIGKTSIEMKRITKNYSLKKRAPDVSYRLRILIYGIGTYLIHSQYARAQRQTLAALPEVNLIHHPYNSMSI